MWARRRRPQICVCCAVQSHTPSEEQNKQDDTESCPETADDVFKACSGFRRKTCGISCTGEKIRGILAKCGELEAVLKSSDFQTCQVVKRASQCQLKIVQCPAHILFHKCCKMCKKTQCLKRNTSCSSTSISVDQTTISGYQTSISVDQTTISGYQTTISGYQTTISGDQTTSSPINVLTTSTVASASSTSAAEQTPTAGPGGIDAPTSDTSAVIIGTVVGGLVAMLLLAVLFLYFWSQRRKRQRKTSHKANRVEDPETREFNGHIAASYNTGNRSSASVEYAEISDSSSGRTKVVDNGYSRIDITKVDQNTYDKLHSMPTDDTHDGYAQKPSPEYFVLEGSTCTGENGSAEDKQGTGENGSAEDKQTPYFVLENENLGGNVPTNNNASVYFVLDAQVSGSGEQSDIKSPEYFVLENQRPETVRNEDDVGPTPKYFVLEEPDTDNCSDDKTL